MRNIFTAIEEEDIKTMREIRQEEGNEQVLGITISIGNGHFYTPLHYAAYEGSIVCIEELIAWGADMEARSSREETPLHMAVCNMKIHAVEKLAKQGAQLDSQDRSGQTPLHHAITAGDWNITQKLLRLGADWSIVDNAKRTPRAWALIMQDKIISDGLTQWEEANPNGLAGRIKSEKEFIRATSLIIV